MASFQISKIEQMPEYRARLQEIKRAQPDGFSQLVYFDERNSDVASVNDDQRSCDERH